MRMPIFLTLIATISFPSLGFSGSAEDIGQRVSPSALRNINQLDINPYDNLLSKYVDTQGRVNYRAWSAAKSDRDQLKAFLLQHSFVNPKTGSKDEKLALWINAYNALTLEGILREYPTTSIKNHVAKVFGYNIWDDLRLYVGGQAYSLNDIEHKILRKMDEPRIHFAIVCASTGCPRLLNEAFRADALDAQLTTNAKYFFSVNTNFAVNGSTVYLSSILDWFGEDFGNDTPSVLRKISPWLPSTAAVPNNARVRYTDYDWSLNSLN